MIHDWQVQAMTEGQLDLVVGDIGECRSGKSGVEEFSGGWIHGFGFVLCWFAVE